MVRHVLPVVRHVLQAALHVLQAAPHDPPQAARHDLQAAHHDLQAAHHDLQRPAMSFRRPSRTSRQSVPPLVIARISSRQSHWVAARRPVVSANRLRPQRIVLVVAAWLWKPRTRGRIPAAGVALRGIASWLGGVALYWGRVGTRRTPTVSGITRVTGVWTGGRCSCHWRSMRWCRRLTAAVTPVTRRGYCEAGL